MGIFRTVRTWTDFFMYKNQIDEFFRLPDLKTFPPRKTARQTGLAPPKLW